MYPHEGTLLCSKRLLLDTLVSQQNPVHTLILYFFKTHFINHSPVYACVSQVSLSFRFSN
jgi:hypothetical protein